MIDMLSPRQTSSSGWSRLCRNCGFEYHVSVQQGKRVRIAFKPRGKNIGYHWHGTVRRDGKTIWEGRVPKSIGVRGLLAHAGVITTEQQTR